jgi:hypothetical protein
MTHTTLRLAMALGVAATVLTGTVSVPAHAESEGPPEHSQHLRGTSGHGGGRYRGAPPTYHYDNYYRQPDIYYSAPPVVVVPQGYYQQPAPALIFSFPLLIR